MEPSAIEGKHVGSPLQGLRIVHGTPNNNRQSIFEHFTEGEVSAMLSGTEETEIVTAHSHLPLDRKVGGFHIMNPGSVGVPLDGNPAASYMLIEREENGWHATLCRVSYDREPLYKELERQNFVERFGPMGFLLLEEF